jgi:hypothetical protein
MRNELIEKFIFDNDKKISDINLTCSEIIHLKEQFYNIYAKKPLVTEAIIYGWLKSNLNIDRDLDISSSELILKRETKYPALHGNQTLDISLVNGKEILFGISIKMSTSTSAYLDGADFLNPFLEEYREFFVKDEAEFEMKKAQKKRIGLPTLLQDMGRILNLKLKHGNFPSLTIIFTESKKKDAQWITEFEEKYFHQYIFLKDHGKLPFVKVLSNKLPEISKWLIT